MTDEGRVTASDVMLTIAAGIVAAGVAYVALKVLLVVISALLEALK